MRSPLWSGSWRRAAVATSVALAALLLPEAAWSLTISNPPAVAGKSFSVKLRGAHGAVSLYLSPTRKLARGDVALGHIKPRRGILHVRVGPKVKPGGYFVVACTKSGRSRRCGSSRKATAVLPKAPRSAPTGVNGAATAAAKGAAGATIGAKGGALTAEGPTGRSTPSPSPRIRSETGPRSRSPPAAERQRLRHRLHDAG